MIGLVLLACTPNESGPAGIDPGADDSAAIDDSGDTGPPPVTDADSDGYAAESAGGDDCDDGNAAVFPGAYDRPDDGVDGDCDGADRTCDCLVLDGGTSVAIPYGDFDTASSRSLDLAYVLETGISATSTIEAATDSFADVATDLDAAFNDITYGVATFDDYVFSSYGSAKPFQLRQQQTDDTDSVQYAFDGIPKHLGEDSVQSAMEGLYQALTGAGYDQDCDASYDSSGDVKPFVADASDPFGGTAGQFLDSTDDSTGAIGMGFHPETALRVIVYSTDNELRDPENGDPSPGGCAFDAGFTDIVAAATDANVWLVGIGTGELPIPQMEDLANATGSLADVDGDGSDEPIVYELEATTDTFRDAILNALDAIRIETGLLDVYASVTLEVRDDPLGIVSAISPKSYTDVDWADVDALAFDVGYDTSAYGAKPVVGSVDFALVGDGFDLATVHVDVEIAPL